MEVIKAISCRVIFGIIRTDTQKYLFMEGHMNTIAAYNSVYVSEQYQPLMGQ